MKLSEFRRVAQAINRYLSYEVLCGREALLEESYLRRPITEYLSLRHAGEFMVEEGHPVFASRQLDYALKNKDTGAIEIAIECKWIGDGRSEQQRILDDILRLECVGERYPNSKRFFLVAGQKDNFDPNFRNLQMNARPRVPFTKYYLPFNSDMEKVTVEIKSCPKRHRKELTKFAETYQVRLPYRYGVRRIAWRGHDGLPVQIWQISSMKNRRTFSPQERWERVYDRPVG